MIHMNLERYLLGNMGKDTGKMERRHEFLNTLKISRIKFFFLIERPYEMTQQLTVLAVKAKM